MNENRILSNVNYTIHNRSNYDITITETKGIIDVPHFPAQNLVDITGDISLYKVIQKTSIIAAVPFYDDNIQKERIFFLHNRQDARMNFIEVAEDARYYHYAFTGTSYPQGREGGAAITYDEKCMYLFGGVCNSRCTQDLWRYTFKDNRWTNLNFSIEEKGANEAPTKRAESSIVAAGDKIWLFGGYTDVLSAHMEGVQYLDLNDLWCFDIATNTWSNYDKNRVLPHRRGHIVYVDDTKVRIAIKGGTAATGEIEPDGIWTVDLTSDTVSFTALEIPFTFNWRNIVVWVQGVVYILEYNGPGCYNVYTWNESATDFVRVSTSNEHVIAVNPRTKNFWKWIASEKHFGDNHSAPVLTVDNFECIASNGDVVISTDITLPPIGVELPRVNIDNKAIFWYGGLIDEHTFNESTYIMDCTTRQVEKLDFPPDARPTERIFPAMAYDRYRGYVWLFGGFDGSKFYNDLWYFDLTEKKWHKVHAQLENTDEENPKYPPPRQKAAMAVVVSGRYLYIMGGYSDEHSFNDLWQYDIANKQWKRIRTVDNMPWGSVYFLFEWRDRLWMFNGQKLYRFIYSSRRFVEQELVFRNANNHLKKIIEEKRYMNLPVDMQLIKDALFIRCPETTLHIDMETRVVTDYKVTYNTGATPDLWLDVYHGVKLTSNDIADYYFNASPLQVLTTNQIPHSFDFGTYAAPNPSATVVFDPFAPAGEPKTSYIDARGIYKIQPSVEHFDDSTVEKLIENNEVAVVSFPSNGIGSTGVGDPVRNKLQQSWVSLYRPIFMYKHTKSPSDKIKFTTAVAYDYRDRKAYIVYKSGHVIKYNLNDGTTFIYNSRIPYQSSVGYYTQKKRFYAFGGAASSLDDYPILTQHGYRYVPFTHTVEAKEPSGEKKVIAKVWQLDTPILRAYDLGLVTLQQDTLENYLNDNNIEYIDYQIIKNYLLDVLKHYTSSNAYRAADESPLTPQALSELEERVKDAIYKSTQDLLDDLSTVDVTFEKGTRPLSRMYAVTAQVGDNLLVAGGAQVFYFERNSRAILTQLPLPAPDARTVVNEPFCPTYIGHLTACQLANNTVSIAEVQDYLGETAQSLSKKAYIFNMCKKEWKEVSPMPEWRYLASAITSPDGKFVYVVGGYTQPCCQGLTNKILRYNVEEDFWEYAAGVPSTFLPRAQPVLFWLDDYHLVIAFGYEAQLVGDYNDTTANNEEGTQPYTWVHTPVRDAWVYDIRSGLLYKAWEDHYTPPVVTVSTKYTEDKSVQRKIYCVSNSALYKTTTEYAKSAIVAFDTTDGTAEKIPVSINSTITKYAVTRERVLQALKASISQATGCKYVQVNNISYPQTYVEPALRKVFLNGDKLATTYYGAARIRYGWIEQNPQSKHNILYLIAETPTHSSERLPDWLQEITGGAHVIPVNMVVWYVDLDEENKHVRELQISAPISGNPAIVGYDGKGYLYFIYNRYAIWKLNFHKFIEDPSNTEWTMLPPCINCQFLDDTQEDYWIPFFVPKDDPKYMVLFSRDGRMVRMDIQTYTWYLDRNTPPAEFTNTELISATGIDNLELYMIPLTSTVHGGKVIHVFEKQWDNFYFDLTMFAINDKQKVYLNPRLYPATVIQRKMYIISEQGHMYYSWLRIDGEFDVEYQLLSFYRAGEVQVYGDYKMLEQWENLDVRVYHIQYGWVPIPSEHFERVVNETGWHWDSVFGKRYVRELVSDSGEMLVQYSTCPPNFIRVKLSEKFGEEVPISKIRIRFRNNSVPYNMISRINGVELVTRQHDINMYSSPSDPNPAEIFHIEALTPEENYSNTVGIVVKNISGAEATNVIAYVKDNYWLEFTTDPNDDQSWFMADAKNPLLISEKLPPGGIALFYIRAVNVDLRPHKDDIVVHAIIPYGM